MADIYSRVPVNKTAGMVVDQSGCTSHLGLDDEQKRKNLVTRWQALVEKIKKYPKKSDERKFYGGQLIDLQNQISALRPKRKFHTDLNSYICDIVKKRMTKDQWHSLVAEAQRNAEREMSKCGR